MADVIVRVTILVCGSLLFFCSLRTIPLSVGSSIALALFFIGTAIYCDPELVLVLQEYRKLKQAGKTVHDSLQKEGK
jgi:hypothetical protein